MSKKTFGFDVSFYFVLPTHVRVEGKNRWEAKQELERWVEDGVSDKIRHLDNSGVILRTCDELLTEIEMDPQAYDFKEKVEGISFQGMAREEDDLECDRSVLHYVDNGLSDTIRNLSLEELYNFWSQHVEIWEYAAEDFKNWVAKFEDCKVWFKPKLSDKSVPAMLNSDGVQFPPKYYREEGEIKSISAGEFYNQLTAFMVEKYHIFQCYNETTSRLIVLERDREHTHIAPVEVRVRTHERQPFDDSRVLNVDFDCISRIDFDHCTNLSDISPTFQVGLQHLCVRVFNEAKHNYRPEFSDNFNRVILHAYSLGYGYVMFTSLGGLSKNEFYGWEYDEAEEDLQGKGTQPSS